MKSIFTLFLLIITTISCEKKINPKEADLIKIGYYDSSIQHFEIIADLNTKSLLFYNPSKYLIPPPAPPQKNADKTELDIIRKEHQNFIDTNPKLEPEYVELSNQEVADIQKIVTSFKEDDFKEDEKKHPVIDGANTNTVILLKNHQLYSIGGYEGTNKNKETDLISKLFSLYKLKCRSKINKVYIQNLENR